MALQSFTSLFRHYAHQQPAEVAVRFGEHSINFQQLDRDSNRWARAYQKRGVQAGNLVTFALPNGIEFFICCLALWKLGAIPQPVSYRLPEKELQAIAALAQTPFIIREGDNPAAEDFSDTPLPEVISPAWKAPTSGGSTGLPKLIVSGEPAEYDPAVASTIRIPNHSAVLIPGPIYHNGPFIAAIHGLLRGNQIIVMPKFDAQACLQLIEQYRVEWTVMVPTMMQRILRLAEATRNQYDLSSLKTLWHMAAPCSP